MQLKIKPLSDKVASTAGRQILTVRANSPRIMFVAGLVGVVATVVLASRATMKMDDVLREAEEKKERIAKAAQIDEEYAEEHRKVDSALNRSKTALTVAKLYAPSFLVGLASVGLLTGSHIVLTNRYAGMSAAYAVLDKGFKEYRARVVEEYGPQKDAEFRYGYEEREIGVETDEGVAVKTIRVLNPTGKASIYARMFDENCDNWQRERNYNQTFLMAQERYANHLLERRGHVFLNEVYTALGMEHTPEGALVGWLKGNHPDAGDGHITFDPFAGSIQNGLDFASGLDSRILLDFNVDGEIWNKIRKGRG